MHYLLFFEFIGTSELLVVLFVALVIFGPRKLPELGRSLGQAMHQLRSASEDFKRTWEAETRLEAATLPPAPHAEPAGTTPAAPQEPAAVDAAPEAQASDVPSYAAAAEAAFGEA